MTNNRGNIHKNNNNTFEKSVLKTGFSSVVLIKLINI